MAAGITPMHIVCVLKRGPEYTPAHLYSMVNSVLLHNPTAKITCLTDCVINHPSITAIPLLHRWAGWWSKIELFRPGLIQGPVLYLDIDTIVTGALNEIPLDDFTMLPNVYRQGDFGSGVMAWVNTPQHIYEEFCKRPGHFMRAYRTREKWGDQAFIRDYLGVKPKVFGREFRSYKVHCTKQVPAQTKVVYFHGKPRPWDVQLCL